MTAGIGIALAFVAMLCWGFGDFWIQKSARRLGDWETLFSITAFGALILLPFVWHRIPALFSGEALGVHILYAASVMIFIAALLNMETLRRGKLAIVEPIWSLEIVSASILSFMVLGQRITSLQVLLIVMLTVGLMLVAFRSRHLTRRDLLEKGVVIAAVAGLMMGAASFFLGWGGKATDPLMANFFTDAFMALATGMYLAFHGRFLKTFTDIRENYQLILPMSISDNVAWIAYVISMTLAPIAVATALSESYIIITVLLGLFVNKEKLHQHQKVGLIAALFAAILLASVTAAS